MGSAACRSVHASIVDGPDRYQLRYRARVEPDSSGAGAHDSVPDLRTKCSSKGGHARFDWIGGLQAQHLGRHGWMWSSESFPGVIVSGEPEARASGSGLPPPVVLGRGKFGEVVLAQCTVNRLFYAVKIIPKKLIWERRGKEQVQSELDMLADLSLSCHPFLCAFFGAWQTTSAVAIVLEYLYGGELFNRMKRVGRFSEAAARFYGAEIALALSFLHEDHHVALRDLKPENVLLDERGHVRIVDFGFARRVQRDSDTVDAAACGTAMYLAPEIASGRGGRGNHGTPVDWWSFGCVLYEMVAGRAPFGDTSKSSKFQVFANITRGSFTFPLYFSDSLKQLLRGLLRVDAGDRFSGDSVRSASWFAEVDWDATLEKRAEPPWVPKEAKNEGDHSNFIEWSDRRETAELPSREAADYCELSIPRPQRIGLQASGSSPSRWGAVPQRDSSDVKQRVKLSRRASTSGLDIRELSAAGGARSKILERRGSQQLAVHTTRLPRTLTRNPSGASSPSSGLNITDLGGAETPTTTTLTTPIESGLRHHGAGHNTVQHRLGNGSPVHANHRGDRSRGRMSVAGSKVDSSKASKTSKSRHKNTSEGSASFRGRGGKTILDKDVESSNKKVSSEESLSSSPRSPTAALLTAKTKYKGSLSRRSSVA